MTPEEIKVFFDHYWNEKSDTWIARNHQTQEQWMKLFLDYSVVNSVAQFTLQPLNPSLWTLEDQEGVFRHFCNGYRLNLLVNSGKHLSKDEIEILFRRDVIPLRLEQLQEVSACIAPVMSPLMKHLVVHAPDSIQHHISFFDKVWNQPIQYVIDMAQYIALGKAPSALVDAFACMIQQYPHYPLKHKEAALLKLYLTIAEQSHIVSAVPDAHIYKATDRKDPVLQNNLKRALYQAFTTKEWKSFQTELSIILNIQNKDDMVDHSWEQLANVFYHLKMSSQKIENETNIFV